MLDRLGVGSKRPYSSVCRTVFVGVKKEDKSLS